VNVHTCSTGNQLASSSIMIHVGVLSSRCDECAVCCL
jgi:hypothetical protein